MTNYKDDNTEIPSDLVIATKIKGQLSEAIDIVVKIKDNLYSDGKFLIDGFTYSHTNVFESNEGLIEVDVVFESSSLISDVELQHVSNQVSSFLDEKVFTNKIHTNQDQFELNLLEDAFLDTDNPILH